MLNPVYDVLSACFVLKCSPQRIRAAIKKKVIDPPLKEVGGRKKYILTAADLAILEERWRG